MTRSIARDPHQFVAQTRASVAAADRVLLDARPDVADAIELAAAEMCRGGTGPVLADALAVIRGGNFSIEDVQVPTFVWQGADDRNVPRSIGEHYGRAVPGAVLRVFEHEGHFVFYRHADESLPRWCSPRAADSLEFLRSDLEGDLAGRREGSEDPTPAARVAASRRRHRQRRPHDAGRRV